MAKKKTQDAKELQDKFLNSFAADVVDTNITDFIEEDNYSYMLYTVMNRALPSVVDGQKPGQRRLLYSMFKDGVTPDAKSRKSSRLASDTVGRFHPHGDAAMYSTLVNLAVPYLRVPLIRGDGSFGMSPGDVPAQSRYTEARLSPFGYALVEELKDDASKFIPTYDGDNVEPEYLTPQFPSLIVNGTEGMSEGFSTTIPAHNPREIMDLCLALMDNPRLSDEDILDIVPGPDWATGGKVIGNPDLVKDYITTGKGTFSVRGKYSIDRKSKAVILEELAPGTKADDLIAKLRDSAREGTIEGVKDVVKASDKDKPFRVIVEAKRGVDLDELARMICLTTPFETTFPAQMVALDEYKSPRMWSLRDMVMKFLEVRDNVLVAKSKSQLERSKAKHIRACALEKVFLDKELAVDTVMKSKTESAAVKALCERFDLSEEQAVYVANLPIKRLSQGSVLDALKEVKKLEKEIKRLEGLIGSKRKRSTVIRKELVAFAKNFEDERYARKTVIDFGEQPVRNSKKSSTGVDRLHHWKFDVLNGIMGESGENIEQGDMVWAIFNGGRLKLFAGGGLPQRISPKPISPHITDYISGGVVRAGGTQDLVIVDSSGKALRIDINTLNPQGLVGSGVVGKKLDDGAQVVGAVLAGDNDVLFTRSTSGWKVTRVDDIPVKGKGTKGVAVHKVAPNDAGVYEVQVSTRAQGFIVDGEQARVSARATGINRSPATTVTIPDVAINTEGNADEESDAVIGLL